MPRVLVAHRAIRVPLAAPASAARPNNVQLRVAPSRSNVRRTVPIIHAPELLQQQQQQGQSQLLYAPEEELYYAQGDMYDYPPVTQYDLQARGKQQAAFHRRPPAIRQPTRPAGSTYRSNR